MTNDDKLTDEPREARQADVREWQAKFPYESAVGSIKGLIEMSIEYLLMRARHTGSPPMEVGEYRAIGMLRKAAAIADDPAAWFGRRVLFDINEQREDKKFEFTVEEFKKLRGET